MPKIGDKFKHSTGSTRKQTKQLRDGRGMWGNPLTDAEFMEEPPRAYLDEKDVNYVPKEELNERNYNEDAWEEEIWHANHEEYDTYFDSYQEEEEPQTQTYAEYVQDLKANIQEQLASLLQGHINDEEFLERVVPENGLELGANKVFAKCFLSPTLLGTPEQQNTLALVLQRCVEFNLLYPEDIIQAITCALRGYPEEDDIFAITEFAEVLAVLNVIPQELGDEIVSLKEITDLNDHVRGVKDYIKEIVREYFTSTEVEEMIQSIHEIPTPFYQYEATKILVSTAFDRDNKCREQASKIIGTPNCLRPTSVKRGFEILLERLDDLKQDVPDATGLLACFIARAISDEAIPPSFIQEIHFEEWSATTSVQLCLQKVQHLVNMKYSAQRLARVWGPGRGRTVQELKESIKVFIKEFFTNRDLNAFVESIEDLNEPNFHHDIIKQCVQIAVDMSGQDYTDILPELFRQLVNKNIISAHQLRLGIHRLVTNIDIYKLDAPLLPAIVDGLQDQLEDLLVVLER